VKILQKVVWSKDKEVSGAHSRQRGGVRCAGVARLTAMYSHNIETSPHGCLAAVQKFPFHVSVFNNHQHTSLHTYSQQAYW